MSRTKIGSLFADVTLNTKGLDKGIRTAQRKLRFFGRDATMTGKQLMLGIGTPLGIIGGQAVNVFQNFEQEMAKVKAISGATSTEFKALEDSAKELGATTRFTATNVSELQLNFSKLGLTPTEINKVTKSTLNLALATGEDLAESARVGASTMKGFGLTAEDMGRITDVMAKSFSSSALDLNKFAEGMKNAQVTAKIAGATLEDTTAMLAVLNDTGTDASKAGTDLRNIFLELNKAGLTLPQAFALINQSSDKMGLAFNLVGKRAMASLITLAENEDKLGDLTLAFENAGGSAQEMADIMDDTLQGSLFKLRSAFEGVQIALGEKLEPVIKKIVDRLSELLSKNQDAIAEFLVTASKVAVLAMSFGAFLFVAGQLAFVMANIIGVFGFLAKAVMMVVTPILLATVAMKAFGLSFVIGGFAVFLKAILIVSTVLGVLKGIAEGLAEQDISWGEFMVKTFAFLATTIETAIGTLGMFIEKVSILGKEIGKFFAMLISGDAQKNTFIENILDQESKIKPFKGRSRRARKQQLQNMSDDELLAIAGVDSFRDAPSDRKDKFVDPNSIGATYDKYLTMFEKFGVGMDKILDGDIAGAMDELGVKADFLKNIFAETEMPPEVAEEIKNIEKAQEELKANLEGQDFTSGFTELVQSFKSSFNSGMDGIKQDVRFTSEEIAGVLEDISNGLTDSLMKFFETGRLEVKSFVSDILSELARLTLQKSVINPFLTASSDFITNLIKPKAMGGAVYAGQPYMVGEKGAELFVPSGGGKIIPNNKLGGGEGSTIVNFNVQATDAQSFDAQIAQREQMLVGIIDKAFHKRGRIGING